MLFILIHCNCWIIFRTKVYKYTWHLRVLTELVPHCFSELIQFCPFRIYVNLLEILFQKRHIRHSKNMREFITITPSYLRRALMAANSCSFSAWQVPRYCHAYNDSLSDLTSSTKEREKKKGKIIMKPHAWGVSPAGCLALSALHFQRTVRHLGCPLPPSSSLPLTKGPGGIGRGCPPQTDSPEKNAIRACRLFREADIHQ